MLIYWLWVRRTNLCYKLNHIKLIKGYATYKRLKSGTVSGLHVTNTDVKSCRLQSWTSSSPEQENWPDKLQLVEHNTKSSFLLDSFDPPTCWGLVNLCFCPSRLPSLLRPEQNLRGTSCAACGTPTSTLNKATLFVRFKLKASAARPSSSCEDAPINEENRLMGAYGQSESHVGVLEVTFDPVVELLSVMVELHDAFGFFSEPEPVELPRQVTCRRRGRRGRRRRTGGRWRLGDSQYSWWKCLSSGGPRTVL